MKSTTFLWPDRVSGKLESAEIRTAHNALANEHEEMKNMLKTLVEMHESAAWSAVRSANAWQAARALLDKVTA